MPGEQSTCSVMSFHVCHHVQQIVFAILKHNRSVYMCRRAQMKYQVESDRRTVRGGANKYNCCPFHLPFN